MTRDRAGAPPLVSLGQGDARRDLHAGDVRPSWSVGQASPPVASRASLPARDPWWQRLLDLWLHRDLHRLWPLRRCLECGRLFWCGWFYGWAQDLCSRACADADLERCEHLSALGVFRRPESLSPSIPQSLP